jgi:hypothetical protein
MEARLAHSLFGALRGDRCAFAYSGAFHDEHSPHLIALGEAVMAGVDTRATARGRLGFIMVEAYQNILRHRAALPQRMERGAGRSLFLLRCQADGQQVVAINPVRGSEVPALRGTLQRLAGLSGPELKSLFLDGLRREQESGRRGAGLGLIEMARRSGSDLGYTLRDVGAGNELFMLAARLGPGGQTCDEVLADAAAFHAAAVEQDLLLLHVGERTPEVEEALLWILVQELRDVPESAARMEHALQAAARGLHGIPGAGRWFLAVHRSNGHHTLAMGRTMPAQQAGVLAARVEELRLCGREEVERRHRLALERPGCDAAEMTLLGLARAALAPLAFTAEPQGDAVLGLFHAVV